MMLTSVLLNFIVRIGCPLLDQRKKLSIVQNILRLINPEMTFRYIKSSFKSPIDEVKSRRAVIQIEFSLKEHLLNHVGLSFYCIILIINSILI